MCLSLSAAGGVAHAFTDPLYFGKPALEGGSEGRWFTGAPADGYDCGVCHTDQKGEELVIEGLPKLGYLPDTTYQIRVAWPLTYARTKPLYDLPPPARLPRAALTAEFVAETAGDSGSITQSSLANLTELERCHGEQKRFGYALYRQPHNGVPAPTSTCDTTNLTRCLIAVRGCGSGEVRINWHSPAKNQGAIWFSTSFVATDAVSLSPDGDQVSTTSIPIAPAGTQYQSQLEQSCSLVSFRSGGRIKQAGGAGTLGPFAVSGGLFVWRSRRRQRKASK